METQVLERLLAVLNSSAGKAGETKPITAESILRQSRILVTPEILEQRKIRNNIVRMIETMREAMAEGQIKICNVTTRKKVYGHANSQPQEIIQREIISFAKDEYFSLPIIPGKYPEDFSIIVANFHPATDSNVIRKGMREFMPQTAQELNAIDSIFDPSSKYHLQRTNVDYELVDEGSLREGEEIIHIREFMKKILEPGNNIDGRLIAAVSTYLTRMQLGPQGMQEKVDLKITQEPDNDITMTPSTMIENGWFKKIDYKKVLEETQDIKPDYIKTVTDEVLAVPVRRNSRGEYEILIQFEVASAHMGYWEALLPGGGKEIGESNIDAVRRELREESELDSTEIYELQDFSRSDSFTHSTGCAILMNPYKGYGTGDEHIKPTQRWFSLRAVKIMIANGYISDVGAVVALTKAFSFLEKYSPPEVKMKPTAVAEKLVDNRPSVVPEAEKISCRVRTQEEIERADYLVFIGGSANIPQADGTVIPTNERDEIYQAAEVAGIPYYNPTVPDYQDSDRANEQLAREKSRLDVYQLSPHSLSAVTMMEIVDEVQKIKLGLSEGKMIVFVNQREREKFVPLGLTEGNAVAIKTHYRELQKAGKNVRKNFKDFAKNFPNLHILDTLEYNKAVTEGKRVELISEHEFSGSRLLELMIKAQKQEAVYLFFEGSGEYKIPDFGVENKRINEYLKEYQTEAEKMRTVLFRYLEEQHINVTTEKERVIEALKEHASKERSKKNQNTNGSGSPTRPLTLPI